LAVEAADLRLEALERQREVEPAAVGLVLEARRDDLTRALLDEARRLAVSLLIADGPRTRLVTMYERIIRLPTNLEIAEIPDLVTPPELIERELPRDVGELRSPKVLIIRGIATRDLCPIVRASAEERDEGDLVARAKLVRKRSEPTEFDLPNARELDDVFGDAPIDRRLDAGPLLEIPVLPPREACEIAEAIPEDAGGVANRRSDAEARGKTRSAVPNPSLRSSPMRLRASSSSRSREAGPSLGKVEGRARAWLPKPSQSRLSLRP